jgi:hypothetical protein
MEALLIKELINCKPSLQSAAGQLLWQGAGAPRSLWKMRKAGSAVRSPA